MSYAERRLRKDRRGKTPQQLRKALADVYAGSKPLNAGDHFTVIELQPDGSEKVIMQGTVGS